jgi:DNA polymerase III delta prime subunit
LSNSIFLLCGAVPYQGVCLTDETLDAIPYANGDMNRAVLIAKNAAIIKKAEEKERQKQEEQARLNEKAVQLAHRDGEIWKFCGELNSRSALENARSLLDPNFSKIRIWSAV